MQRLNNIADPKSFITMIMILIFVAAVVLAEIIRFYKKHTYHYKKRENFLTKHELGFYRRLCNAVHSNRNVVVFSKVRLADIIEPKFSGSNWQAQFNKIQAKHVDFLLCDATDVQPILVIELDDRSHDRPDRRERDAFVDRALSQAGIPILHVRNSEGLKAKIEAAI